jgi:hypothetical protein
MFIILLAQPSSFFGIGPVIERVDSDNTSTSVSIDKSVKQVQPVNTVLQPVSNVKSWSDDTVSALPTKKQEPRSNSWDTSLSDDDATISKPKRVPSNLQRAQPFSPSTNDLTSSDTDNNSVETEIRKLDIQKPSIENLVNKQISNGYKVIGLPEAQSPLSDDSSWTTSLVPFNKESTTKGTQNLVLKPKIDESTWDDSRPLSADLKVRKNSDDLSSLLRSTDSSGVENLIKIVDTIIHSNKKQTSPKVIGKLLVSSMVDRTDSALSQNSLHGVDNDEEYERMNLVFLVFFFSF